MGALLFVLALPVCAESVPGFDAQLEASGAGALAGALPEDTQDLLHALGVDGIDLYALLETSPRQIVGVLFNMLQGGLWKVLKSGAVALGMVLLLAFAFAALPEEEKTRRTLEVAGSMLALLLLLPGLAELMRGAAAVVKTGSGFSLLLIPILAGVITAAGNPSLALSYHTMTFAAAQGLSQLADGVVVPCTGIVLALGFVPPEERGMFQFV